LKPISWTIGGQPLTVPYNGKVTISGTLRDAASGVALTNRSAKLCYTLDATDYDSWVSLTTVNSATGQFSAQASGIQRRTYFSWLFDGDTTYVHGSSGDVTIMPRAKLTPPAFGATVRAGVLVTKWGTLRPMHSLAANAQGHTQIYFYRYSNGKWRLSGHEWATSYRNTKSVTKYSAQFRSSAVGKWRVRAIHADYDHAKTTSSWRYFRVR
jgi:hypothetical protein